jgi:uncharacterized membrane protein
MARFQFAIGCIYLLVVCCRPAAAVTFTVLPAGLDASALSGDGQFVFGPTGGTIGRWSSAAGLVDLGGDQPIAYFPRGASYDGSTFAGFHVGAGSALSPLRWSLGDGVQFLPALPDDVAGQALGISADGQTIVGSSHNVAGHAQPVLWRAPDAQPLGLGFLPGDYAEPPSGGATAVSADGSVVVGVVTNPLVPGDDEIGFRWTQNEGMAPVGDLPGGRIYSIAQEISADGSVIFGVSSSAIGAEPFRWTQEEGMVGLGLLPGHTIATVNAISADGSVLIGNSSNDAGGDATFIWDRVHGLQDFKQFLLNAGADIAAWRSVWAVDISADGQTLIGVGGDPQNNRRSFIITVPEPSTLMLALLASSTFALLKRRRRP